jgi:Domain of unknown function (DUF4386)
MNFRSINESPQVYARLAGGLYIITIVAGSLALVSGSGQLVANLVAAASYLAVTVLFYYIFRPVNRGLSLLAALLSLSGCILSALHALQLVAVPFNPPVLFGFYCLLIGYLVFNSTFLPRILGVFMAIGGLGWLTFLSEQLSGNLSPYNYAPGIIAETALTLWLVVRGVDVPKWKERASVCPSG